MNDPDWKDEDGRLYPGPEDTWHPDWLNDWGGGGLHLETGVVCKGCGADGVCGGRNEY